MQAAPTGIKILLALVVAALGVAGYANHSQTVFEQHAQALRAEIATFHRQRWERPNLRGRALEGNATELAAAALAELAPLGEPQREAFAERIYFGKAVETGAELLAANAAALDALREATQRGWGMQRLAVGQGAGMAVPEYPVAVDAALMLGVHALDAPPDDCLAIAADTTRFGQDLVPGAPLEAASVAARIASLMAPVVARCARVASLPALQRAAREFHTLSRHPPPTGNGLELADLLAKVDVLEQARLDRGVFATLRRRPALYRALGYLAEPTRWRSLSPSAYPEGLAEWRRELDWRASSNVPVVAAASEGIEGWLLDDMRGQAVVRALTLGLATAAQRQRTDKVPSEPPSLADRALADPFTGRPMHWRIAEDGSEIAVWSVGENLRDEMGTDDWSEQAPLDVTIHVPLKEPPKEAKRSARRRRAARMR